MITPPLPRQFIPAAPIPINSAVAQTPAKKKIKVREKGARGERKVIDWLQPVINRVYADYGISEITPKLQRNSLQSDEGGFDIVGLDWLCPEVKNVEDDRPGQIQQWWNQAVRQAEKHNKKVAPKKAVPVLFYMKANWPIRCRINLPIGYGIAQVMACVDIGQKDFEEWFRLNLEAWCDKVLNATRITISEPTQPQRKRQ